MYVLLPNEGKTVDEVLKTLNGNNWTKQLNQFNMSSKVDLKIPRFSTSGETDLVPPLMKAGVLSIFDANVSDLSNICSNNNLYVSIFKQNVRVEVNERGTVAQAVTAATGMSTGVESNKIYTFYANRPFVYIVQESSSMAIFFMGIYRGN